MSRAGKIRSILFGLALALCTALPASAQSVVFANSDPLVTIHSNFAGQTVTLFGNIEPDPGETLDPGVYNIVVLVRGPTSDRVVEMKDRRLGMILTADRAFYRRLPGYYAVLSSAPRNTILGEDDLAQPRLSLEGLANAALAEGDGERFNPELVRLMEERGLFYSGERSVTFLSHTTFATRIPLPAHIPNGVFIADALVVHDGEIVAQGSTRFLVRTEGFERALAVTSRDQPLYYGLAAVVLALVTGWLGGVLFRR